METNLEKSSALSQARNRYGATVLIILTCVSVLKKHRKMWMFGPFLGTKNAKFQKLPEALSLTGALTDGIVVFGAIFPWRGLNF